MTGQDAPSGWGVRGIVSVLLSGALLAVMLIAGFMAGRGEATAEARSERPIKPEAAVTRGAGGVVVTLTSALQRQSGIETRRPSPVAFRRRLRAYGSILTLQGFTGLSDTIADARAQLATAQARLAAARAALQRAQVLHRNGQNYSTAQLQTAEADYRSDAASVQAARVKVRNAKAGARQAWGPVLGKALAGGTALAQDLIQRRRLLVQVTLPVGTALMHPPPKATMETTAGEHIAIDSISPATRTDPQIQGVSFFYAAPAAGAALPGMNVTVGLPVGRPAAGIAIPAQAVVWLHGRAWVYVQARPHAFTRRAITTSLPQAGGGYIVPAQGLPKHAAIVVSGAQGLLSQEFNAQIDLGSD